MFTRKILLIASIFTSISLFAQKTDGFETITSRGSIPEYFLQNVSSTYTQNVETISTDEEKRFRKAKEEFYLQSAFNLKDILLSGNILYNDDVSDYLNRVLDVILKDDPELRSKLTVHTMKSDIVNAYATNEGVIFFSLALFSRLENEAQAAFILCHELIHFKNKHVIDGYVEKVDLRKGRGRYSDLKWNDKNVAKYSFSKDLEMEADREGLKLYLETDYTTDHVEEIFNILKFAYLPMESDSFHMSFFESENLKFPTEYHLVEVDSITAEDDENDVHSTHPNAMKRKSAAKGIIQYQDTIKGTKEFIVSESEFHALQQRCKYEVCRQNLLNSDYKKAIYNAYCLLQKAPKSRYLKKMIGKGLYYEAVKSTSPFSFDLKYLTFDFSSRDKTEGESHRLFHFIEKLEDPEITTLALKYNWALRDNAIDDEELDLAIDHLFELVAAELDTDTSWYFKRSNVDSIPITDSLDEGEFIRYALMDELEDQEFVTRFIEAIDRVEMSKNEIRTDLQYSVHLENRQRESRIKRKYGEALGLDKVVILNPRYKRFDRRKDVQVQYLESEHFMLQFDSNAHACAQQLNMDIEILNARKFKTSDSASFNDNALLYEWFTHKMKNMKYTKLVSPIHNEVQPLIKKYGTSKFSLMAAVAKTYKKSGRALALVLGAVTVVGLPYSIAYVASANHYINYVTVLYDIKTGDLEMAENSYIKEKSKGQIFRSNLYHTLQQYHYIR